MSVESVTLYRNVLIKVVYFDTQTFHWYAYQGNKKLTDSLKQCGYNNNDEAIYYAKQEIDFLLEDDEES